MHGGGSRGLWQGAEAIRREERRAKARLQGGLQRLEKATSYHLNTLTTEQRRLHRDLFNIRSGNSWRRGLQPLVARPFNPDPSHPLMYNRNALPTISRTNREPEKQKSVKASSRGVSGPAALQAQVHDFLCSSECADTQIHGTGSSVAPLCLPNLKLQPAASLAITGLARRGEKGGQPRTLLVLPDFSHSLAEARKARYIRYRGQPPCEMELSITEIFARGNTSSTHRI
ncbi:hypothetical protein DPEC_G00341470 [Dallia pectoralis]|uniref:Uncharacterized protein n=1 Tax=Dallia pectoralis TaxID=75939 RepID=A0ACC2F5F5_DALPE|nr:hypothetical protein DPEC_G00341470 [Dallia pectoralis]